MHKSHIEPKQICDPKMKVCGRKSELLLPYFFSTTEAIIGLFLVQLSKLFIFFKAAQCSVS